jgi:hypothetical protein
MGTMIDLRVGNLVADWGKNEFYRDHRSLFQKRDVRSVLAGQDGMINTLSRPLRDVVPRLHLLGYTGNELKFVCHRLRAIITAFSLFDRLDRGL